MDSEKVIAIGLGAGLIVAITIGVAAAQGAPGQLSLRGGGPCDSQPKMQAALRSLGAARDALNGALPDKGGHRAAAIGLIRTTIDEVQAGCMAGGG